MRVVVQTGARIHLGFYGLCDARNLLRLGGVGIGVDGVGYKLTLSIRQGSRRVKVVGCQSNRAEAIAKKALRDLNLDLDLSLKLEECVPEHVGLGSTTQLTLSIYAALAVASGRSLEHAVNLAKRGPYSGIGTGVFLKGGFVLDSGVRVGEKRALPALSGRVPHRWRLVAVIPSSRRGIGEGADEDRLMAVPRGLERESCCKAYEYLLRGVIPGLAFSDLDLFGWGVEGLQRLTGMYFSAAQGSTFCCRESEEAAHLLKRLGARGVGQSSWGPLVYGFFGSEKEAVRAADSLAKILGDAARVLILSPRNKPAEIRVEDSMRLRS
ncbi:MAG: hypothetical protein ABWW70_07880 [Thermoproteota archaeon]